MNKVFDKHNSWIGIVESFGCNKETAKDIVQDMYVKVQTLINKGLDISYNDDDINYYYIFRTLQSIYYNQYNKEKKVEIISLDYCNHTKQSSILNYEEIYNDVKDILDTLHWYDKKVYNLLETITIRDLSNKTGISYHSLYNTNSKVKKYIKKRLEL